MSDLQWALDSIGQRLERYRLYGRYYAGEHNLAYATNKWRTAFGSLFKAFADNMCQLVIDVVCDRLNVIGMDSETGDDAVVRAAWAIWNANQMPRQDDQVHREALRAGDAYVIVWPDDDGRPRIYPQRAAAVTIRYDLERPGAIVMAAKWWLLSDKRVRVNLYYPDRIEKYVSSKADGHLPEKASVLIPFEVDGEEWPLSNLWGRVPVVHFANGVGIGEMGVSDLANIIPLQDALNKSVLDMLIAMEFVALPQRWITGLEVELGADGQPRAPFTPGADRVWAIGSPDARLGEFAAADLKQFIMVQDAFRLEIARISGIPTHYLMMIGDFPSGEAMKTMEARLVAKVKALQSVFGAAWSEVLALALAMVGLDGATIAVQWSDPTPRADKEFAETLLLKQQIGVSNAQLQREAGYSEEQIAAFAEDIDASSTAMAEKMLTAFERGR